MCKFFRPACFSRGTRTPSSKTLFAAGMGSAAESNTTSRQVWSAALVGVLQSHSIIAGIVLESKAMVLAGAMAVHAVPLGGNAVQKSDGSGGTPADAFAK